MSVVALRGVLPVLAVPFTPDEQLDRDGFEVVVDRQVAAGVDGVMFPGFASEFHKLADAERRALVTQLIETLDVHRRAGRRAPIAVVSVSEHATAVAVREACWAVEAGADAINLLPPFLLGPSPAAVDTHLRAVLSAVAPVPVIVQHAPSQTGASLTVADLVAVAADHANLRTVKVESQPPGRMVAELATADPPLASLVGYAGLHLPDALERGAVGVQPGCSFPELYVALLRAWAAGDRAGAGALHARMLPYLSAWMTHVELIVAVEKALAVARGWFAHATVRAPGWELDALERARVEEFLEEFRGWLEP